MTGLFWGFLLIFLDFSLDLHGHEVGLLPDFLGFLIASRAAGALIMEGGEFTRLQRFCRSLVVPTAGLYALELFGLSQNLGMLGHLLSLCCTAAGLYAAWLLTRCILILQQQRSMDLMAARLHSAWTLLAVCQMLGYLFLMNPLMSTLCALAALGAGIYYLFCFSRSGRAFSGRVQ